MSGIPPLFPVARHRRRASDRHLVHEAAPGGKVLHRRFFSRGDIAAVRALVVRPDGSLEIAFTFDVPVRRRHTVLKRLGVDEIRAGESRDDRTGEHGIEDGTMTPTGEPSPVQRRC